MTAPGDKTKVIPYGRQLVEEDDIAAVCEVLRGDWLTTGPTVRRFETDFAARVKAPHAVACSSGTAGLHLATMALGLGPGDVAIVPSVTFLATANAVRYVGAEVVFADVDPDTGLLTPTTFEAALGRVQAGTPRAVLPVHLGGAVADMPAIAPVAAKHGLAVVEDACHAVGAVRAGETVGSCASSNMAVFSTHPVKTITTGEGGVVTCRDEALADRLRRLRSHGMESDSARWLDTEQGTEGGESAPWYYEMAEMGFNYRLTDIACALGISQLRKLDRFIARRSELAARYDRLLAPLAPRVKPPARSENGQPGWHLYAARIDFDGLGITRTAVMQRLRSAGVGTQVHYIPVHRQPFYRQRYGVLDLPGADAYYRRTLSLPLFPAMRDDDVDLVVHSLTSALGLA